MDFFYRIDSMSFTPGWKTAGFVAVLSTKALRHLRSLPMNKEAFQTINMTARERLIAAKILPKKMVAECWIMPFENTWAPLMFTTDRTFGGSIGGQIEDLQRLEQDDVLEWVGPVVSFTPHNCDTPAQSLALLILFQTWAEYAQAKLFIEIAN
jgi:hypothetical protein